MKINIIAFSTNGCRVAQRIIDAFPDEDIHAVAKTKMDTLGIERLEIPAGKWTGEVFGRSDALVFIGATGIAVRYIAPYVKSKTTDPAVISMDEHGKWTIALLAGHIGGANELALRIADRLGSEPIVTTATDINGKFSVDTFATHNDLRIMGMGIAQDVSVRVLNGLYVGLHCEIPCEGTIPPELTVSDSGEFGICISEDSSKKPFVRTMRLIPEDIVLGIGCRRGTDPGKLRDFVLRILEREGICKERVGNVCSIDLKKDEEAILDLAHVLKAKCSFYTADELMSLEGEFTSSDFVKSVTSVDCVSERSAMMPYGGELILRKTAESGMTVAICRREMTVRF